MAHKKPKRIQLKQNRENKAKYSKVLMVLAVVFIAIGSWYIGFRVGSNKISKDNEGWYEGNKATRAQVTELQEVFSRQLTYMLESNTFINIVLAEDVYDSVLYNPKGEVVTVRNDGQNVTIKRKDGVCYSVEGEYVSYGENTDSIKLLTRLCEILPEVDVYKLEIEDADENDKYVASDGIERKMFCYEIHVTDWEQVKKLYTNVSEEFADSMVSNLKTTVGEGNVHFIYRVMLTDMAEMSISCSYISNGTKFLNWYIDGYMTVGDWQLNEEWYNYDFESDEDGSVISELINSQMENINTMMDQFMQDVGYISEEDVSASGEGVDNNE